MIDFKNSAVFKLKKDPGYAKKAAPLLLDSESVLDSYKAGRDGIVFTDKRIVVINVQGLTGKKQDFTSIPISKIQAYSVETAGSFDRDAELEIYISSIGRLRFAFKAGSDVITISKHISQSVL